MLMSNNANTHVCVDKSGIQSIGRGEGGGDKWDCCCLFDFYASKIMKILVTIKTNILILRGLKKAQI